MKTLRNAFTALTLLIVALAGFEFWLQGKSAPALQRITGRASDADQSLLVVSSVCHHELQRLLETRHVTSHRSGTHLVRVNSLGCRGDEFESPAPIGVFRILVLGDDSICGTSVDESETVPARLQQLLSKQTAQKLEVINGGVPGYCPLLSWIKFEHDLAKLKPDLVVLHVDMTDVADDVCYRSLLMKENQHAVCSHPALRLKPKPEHVVTQFVKKSATASWLFTQVRDQGPDLLSAAPVSPRAGLFDWVSDNPPDLRLQVRHALEPISRLKESVEGAGGQFLVTTAPVLWQIVSSDAAPQLSRQCGIRGTTPYHSRFPFEVLQAFCNHADIRFCDTSPTFGNGEGAEKLFSIDAPVLSRIGMALYAREIARYLITNPPADW